MKKYLALVFICLSCSGSPLSVGKSDKDITGLWKSRDDKVDKPRSLVAIYEYQGKYYGRMLVTYGEDGQVTDTILQKKDKAPGIKGNPPYCGMDFVYGLKSKGNNRYEGNIVDPQKGKIYDVEVWRAGADLNVRGKLWIFGKTMKWHPGSEKDLPKGFKMSEIKKFVPVIPEPN